jgi:hypothetical protein
VFLGNSKCNEQCDRDIMIFFTKKVQKKTMLSAILRWVTRLTVHKSMSFQQKQISRKKIFGLNIIIKYIVRILEDPVIILLRILY